MTFCCTKSIGECQCIEALKAFEFFPCDLQISVLQINFRLLSQVSSMHWHIVFTLTFDFILSLESLNLPARPCGYESSCFWKVIFSRGRTEIMMRSRNSTFHSADKSNFQGFSCKKGTLGWGETGPLLVRVSNLYEFFTEIWLRRKQEKKGLLWSDFSCRGKPRLRESDVSSHRRQLCGLLLGSVLPTRSDSPFPRICEVIKVRISLQSRHFSAFVLPCMKMD